MSLDNIVSLLGIVVKNPPSSRRSFFAKAIYSLFAQDPQKTPAPDVTPAVDAALRKTYAKELSERTTDSVRKLLDDAINTKDDPATQFPLLLIAAERAVELYHFTDAFKAIDEIDKLYAGIYMNPKGKMIEVKATGMKKSALDKAREQKPKGEQLEALVNGDIDFALFEMGLGQKNSGHYDEAVKAAKNAATGAGLMTPKSKVLDDKATAIQKYAADLSKNKDDEFTQAKVKYFIQNDSSEDVLKILSNGSDAKLKKLASLMTVGGKTPENYYEYGDVAYDAVNESGRLPIEKFVLQSNALDLYRQVISTATGAAKTKYERDDKLKKRISELETKISQYGGTGGIVDLLRMIDLKKDVVQGTWKLDNGSLISPIEAAPKIQIPYVPPDEYDLQLTVECLSTPEAGSFVVGLAGREWQTAVQFNCEGRMYFFEYVDGKPGGGQYRVEGKYIKMNQPADLKLSVRKDKITAAVDGKQILEIKDYAKRVSIHPFWKVPSTQTLFIGEQNTQYRLKQIKLTPVSGRGAPLQR